MDEKICGNQSAHHQELSFSLAPGESRSVRLPRLDVPVQIVVSASGFSYECNGTVQFARPIVVEGVWIFDSIAGRYSQEAHSAASVPEDEEGHYMQVTITNHIESSNVDPSVVIRSRVVENRTVLGPVNYVVHMWY